MGMRLKSKTANIMIVDPAASARRQRMDILNALGYANIDAVENIEQAIQKLQEKPCDWLITPVCEASKVHGMHILQLCEKNAHLSRLLVTFMVDVKANYYLYKAFELGLFSWFKNTTEKSVFKKEIDTILDGLAKENWDTVLFAGNFVRSLMNEERKFSDLYDFETSLSQHYPSNAQVLMHLALAQFQAGKNSLAHKTMKLAQVIDPTVQGRAIELTQLYGKDETPSPEAANPLDIKGCVVIEPDDVSGTALVKVLTDIGVKPSLFKDGNSAWDALKAAPEPSIIVMEWKLTGLSAPVLIQRIRQNGFKNTPIVVISKEIDEADLPLLREMEVSEIIKKPIEPGKLLGIIAKVARQALSPVNPLATAQQMRRLLSAGNLAEAEKLRDQACGNPDFPTGWRYQIVADFLYHKGDYEGAKQSALQAMKQGGEVVICLNLLGKSFMKLRDFDNAKKCLDNAQFLSPFSIERLCAMAEVSAEMGKAAEAKETIADAKDIDAANPAVNESEAKVALAAGDIETCKTIMGQLDSLGNVIAFMNNRAVALARSAQLNDAVNLYDGAIKAIPTNKTEVLSQVRFNLGLAHLRGGKMQEAKVALDECLTVKGTKIAERAEALRLKVVTAIENKKTLTVAASAPPVVPADPGQMASIQEIMTTIRAKVGDRCCFMIFSSAKIKVDDRLAAMLQNTPPFEAKYSI